MNDHTEISGEKDMISRGCCASSQILDKNKAKSQHSCPKLDAYEWLEDIQKNIPSGSLK